MKTKIISLYPDFQIEKIYPPAQAILAGELVAFPTETVYGLGANAYLSHAIEKVFQVKERPQDNPLIVHLSQLEQLKQIAINIPQEAYILFQAFAPGPLTLILEKNDRLPDIVSSGLSTVAVRFPSNEIAKALIEISGVPIVAPSANLSGRPSPTQAWHVYEDLKGKIPYILDGGKSSYGLESTIVDLTSGKAEILRPGHISAQDIIQKTGIHLMEYNRNKQQVTRPKAPGQKYRHYSPAAKVMILKENPDLKARLADLEKTILFFIKEKRQILLETGQKNVRIALFLSADIAKSFQESNSSKLIQEQAKALVADLFSGQESDFKLEFFMESYDNSKGAAEAAHKLYNKFREFDRKKVDLIVCTAEAQSDSGIAYMNRLGKAAIDEV